MPPAPFCTVFALSTLLLPAVVLAQLAPGEPATTQGAVVFEPITSASGIIDKGDAAPGILEISGDQVQVFLADANGAPVGAGSTMEIEGQPVGRVASFTHGSFTKGGSLTDQPDGAQMMQDLAKWASGGNEDPSIGLHPDSSGLTSVFPDAEVQDPDRTRCDVYFVIAQRGFDPDAVRDLRKHVERGGGLVVSATPWAFAKDYPLFSKFPANQLLAGSGIAMKPRGNSTGKTLNVLHTDVEIIQSTLTELFERGEEMSASELESAFSTLGGAGQLRGQVLDDFLTRLLELNHSLGTIIPTKENPIIPATDLLKTAVVNLETQLNRSLPAGKMYAIPASADYPGEVPADAPRETLSPTIDGRFKGWLSGRNAAAWNAAEMRPTGLYAAPGELITVTIPEEVVGRGYSVVIGVYNGGLDNRDKWSRYPKLQHSASLNAIETTISNGLGGLITIRVPPGADLEPFQVKIDGAVRAPVYVHGKMSVDLWKDNFRDYPAPWAELVSDRIIITVPSEEIRRLNDPDEVMEIWDTFIDESAVLVGVDRNDYRAERIVFDRLTSAGSMHSSYPVAAHIGTASAKAVDSRALATEGDWGFFHEYGHNHQHNLWALPGTGETTCNLWSVYLYEKVIGKSSDDTHRAIRPLDRKQRMSKYFADGRKFERDWSMWVALEPYLQIQETFGWEPFTTFFKEYNTLPESEWPKGQQEINDQFVIRMSRAVGKDLSDFWQTWNLPLSESVEAGLDDLDDWETHPVAKFAER